MDVASTRLLQGFAGSASGDHLQPDDWRRFFEFIIDAYERDVAIGADEVRSGLAAARFPDTAARDLAAFYDRARNLLEHRDDRVI